MTTPDLSPEEREALRCAVTPFTGVDDDTVVRLIIAALEACPRLREIPGMGLRDEQWFVRYPDGSTLVGASKSRAVDVALRLNARLGPGHHAVRLAVVEVATPNTEEQGND